MERQHERNQQTHEKERRVPAGSGLTPVRWLENLAPYDPVSSLEKIWSKSDQVPFKLDWNEATIPPSPRVYEAIVSFLSNSNHLNWYPELGSKGLCNALSDYVGLPQDCILVTNGSDDALELICKAYLGPSDRAVVPMPTYTHFLVFVQARGAEVVPFQPEDPFDPAVEELHAALRQGADLVYLVSPNNPSGVTYQEEQVAWLAESYPETLFVLDEAYHEFCDTTGVRLVAEYENVVVTRTFSKCFGIAGLRIGYLCAGPSIMHQLKKLFNPKSVNRLGQIAAIACLSDLDYYAHYVDEVTRAKEFFQEEMARRGIYVRKTPANYVLMRVGDPVSFCRLLEDEGVYVRDRSSLPGMESFVRISVPTMDQTCELIRRIDRALERHGR